MTRSRLPAPGSIGLASSPSVSMYLGLGFGIRLRDTAAATNVPAFA